MSFARETSGGRRASPESDSGNDGAPGSKSGKKKRADDPQIGNALRSVYQRTIDEDIPPDLLDLLGKLG